MASFKKHGNGYQGTIYAGLKADGKRNNLYVQAITLKECKSLARQIEEDLEKKIITNYRNVKISAFLEHYLALYRTSLADTTYINYKMYVNKHFKPFFKNAKFNQITDTHIKMYISEKMSYLSSTTVRKHILFLRMIFAEAKCKHIFDGIEIPKNKKYKPTIPNDEQFNLIVADCKSKKKELIILIAGKCGLRLGEIFALKWDDINFSLKEIRIDEAYARNEERNYSFKPPKSDNGYRTVPCPDNILEKLQDYRRNPYKSKRGFLKTNIISIQIFDGRPDNFSNNFGKSMDKLGLGDIRFHDLRHYCASWLYKNNIPDHVAAELLGHDIAVLKGIYQHIGLDEKARYREQIRRLQNDSVATDMATISL